ncbi:sensor histidine kinase [Pelagibacterium montanilacus]|uniref:sensor histidine kinase n=1 Tax=Pelagibacterium montanilacus TaxID=2185280 RepID=UPI0013DFFC7A|nr:PAS domain S-box protein [Pelagibacterium montanilacus]
MTGKQPDTDVELARLAAIVASTSDAIVSKDLNGIINSWNQAAERIFGYTADEIIGQPITTIIPAELQFEERGIISKIRRGERVEHFDTVRLTRDGRRIHVSITVSPVRNSSGVIVGASKIARDVTERKRSEQLQATLVNELNHRTKNLLVTVQAIAARTFVADADQGEALGRFRERLNALAISQDLLVRSGWRGAPLAEVIGSVIDAFDEAYRIRLEPGPDLHLNLGETRALAMAVHELAMNAIHHGALSTNEGLAEVSWGEADGTLTLRWAETGGPSPLSPERTGFGTAMIRDALRHELDADVDLSYPPEGFTCLIRFPARSAEAHP